MKIKLRGCYVALVTPFDKKNRINYEKIEELVEKHIQWKSCGLVPLGTTGETPTLSDVEYKKVMEVVIRSAKKRIPIVVGTGSNNTESALEKTRLAKELGADAALVVLPYYNKPSQNGLRLHLNKLNEVGLPLIPYNIPGRTGVNLMPETLKTIFGECENILGIKESSGNLDQISEVCMIAKHKYSIMSGDDSLTLPILSVGGSGVISVIANIFPHVINEMIEKYQTGMIKEATAIHQKIYPLCKALLSFDVNPVPIKCAMNILGYDVGSVRLPLADMSPEQQNKLRDLLTSLEING